MGGSNVGEVPITQSIHGVSLARQWLCGVGHTHSSTHESRGSLELKKMFQNII